MNSSEDESSIEVRIIPINERRGKTDASSSDLEPSCSSQERKRRCIVEVTVERRLSESCLGSKGVTVCVLQSDLHRVRICTPEGIKQKQQGCNSNNDLIRVWSNRVTDTTP